MLTANNILQGRYRIVRQLGHGGMGAVYEAEDKKRFNAPVALKEILVDLANTTNGKQRELLKHAFEREAKILAEVQHEVFPHVIEYFSEDDRQFLVMELVQGADLAELLVQRKAPFTLDEILQWTSQLLDALDYLHSNNPPIFHRDLKPQNLKLTGRGKIKLLDFGIAKSAEALMSPTITNQTFIAATLNYSPFEQILRVLDPTLREVITERYREKIEPILEQNADARSDLYALGATLYHLSTAIVPTDALKRTLEIWSNHADPLRLPRELNAEIPEEISQIILKAMEIERENRFASATEMQQALNQALADIKHREEEAVRKREEAQRAIWLAEQKRLEKERLEHERLRIETERERLEKERQESERKFHEAEIQRQIAEQERLRIEAEQQRLEKELQLAEQEFLRSESNLGEFHQNQAKTQRQITQEQVSGTMINSLPEINDPNKTEVLPTNLQIGDNLTQQSYLADFLSEPANKDETPKAPPAENPMVSSSPSLIETKSLPFTRYTNRKVSWLLPVAILTIVIFSGAVLGIWLLRSSDTQESRQTNSNQNNSMVTETTPEPRIEVPPPEADIVPASAISPISETTSAGQTAIETKSAATRGTKPVPQQTAQRSQPNQTPRPSQSVKPNTTPTITLDDIIKPRKNP